MDIAKLEAALRALGFRPRAGHLVTVRLWKHPADERAIPTIIRVPRTDWIPYAEAAAIIRRAPELGLHPVRQRWRCYIGSCTLLTEDNLMMLHGTINYDGNGKVFGASVEALGAYVAGPTREATREAMAATILEQISEYGPVGKLRVSVTDDGEQTVYVTASEPLRLLALLLRRQRESAHMSLADVAEATGAKSRNGYAQYEQGRLEPSISKLAEMLAAVASDFALAIVPRTARVIPRWDDEADDAMEIARLIEDPSPANIQALRDKHARTLAKRPAARSKLKARAATADRPTSSSRASAAAPSVRARRA